MKKLFVAIFYLATLFPAGAQTITPATSNTYTAPFTGAVTETQSAYNARRVYVKDFGAVCDGSTDDTAAIQAALNTGKTIILPDNVYCKTTSAVNITITGTGLVGSGENSSGIRITSTTSAAITVAADVQYVTLSNFVVLRTGTPTAGANGIIFNGDTQQANLENLWIEGHWNGLVLRTTGYSTIRNVVVSRNFNDGLNATDIAGHSGFQWYINGLLSQLNAHNGFTFATGNGTTAASVGNWDGLYSFANTNFGLVLAGTAGQPIPGLRLSNSFFGQDGAGEVLLDSYGGLHNISNSFFELAGTSVTGPTFSTPASGVGVGLNVSTNNTDIIVNGIFSTANSQSGAILSATVMNAVSSSRLTLNLGYGVLFADGTKSVLNSSSFASNGISPISVTASASSLMACGNLPISVNNCLGLATNLTGTAAGLTAGNVTTNANQTGAVTSVGNATSLGSFTSANLSGALTDETGSGVAVFNTSPNIANATFSSSSLFKPASGTLTVSFQDGAPTSTTMFTQSSSAIKFSNNGSLPFEFDANAATGQLLLNTDGSVSMSGQKFMPNITTSSAAQTGTVCWTTGTGKFTVDTTVGCLTSIIAAKNITERLAPAKALDIVARLDPFAFKYKKGYGDSGHYEQFGFGAEEVALVDERLVGRDPEGVLHGVRYQEMTAVLAGAIQKLKADNDNLRTCQQNWKCRIFGIGG